MWLQIASLNNENLEQTFVAGRKREETKHVQRVEKTREKQPHLLVLKRGKSICLEVWRNYHVQWN